jgi:hypothetical protein
MDSMTELCATSLAHTVRGALRLSSLPPLGGAWEPVYAVRLDASQIQPGDVLLTGPGLDERVVGRRQFAEEAFARQAVGIVTGYRQTEPWAGTFVVNVSDAREALMLLAARQRRLFRGSFVAIYGGARGERLADLLHILLAQEHEVQRLAPTQPYDLVSMSQQLLDLRLMVDVAVCAVPEDDSDSAGRASRLASPHMLINLLKGRHWEIATGRELRRGMPADSRVVTPYPLPELPPHSDAQLLLVGETPECDVQFDLRGGGTRGTVIRCGEVAWGTRIAGNSLQEDMLLLAACLELGMTVAELKRAWQQLTRDDRHRRAA